MADICYTSSVMRNETQTPESEKAMKIQKTRKNGQEGNGFVMFGAIDGDLGKWFERWFPSVEKAQAYAARKGWEVVAE